MLNFSAVPPPKLTVNPSMITETNLVRLSCQTPSDVSVSQCFFSHCGQEKVRGLSRGRTLTGTELLIMARQKSPVVEVTCCYTAKLEGLDSPHSEASYITIQSAWFLFSVFHMKPYVSVQDN